MKNFTLCLFLILMLTGFRSSAATDGAKCHCVPPTIYLTKINGCCSTGGSATVHVSCGVSPYTYLWSNGGHTVTINNLGAGNYAVTVTGANGCSASASVCISVSSAPVASICNIHNVSCFGGNNGSMNSNASGGTSPYSFHWNNGATTHNISNLSAGTYRVTVTDSHGCSATAAACINQPVSGISASATATNIRCYGGNDGSVNLTVNGGSAPYSFIWSNGATTQNISNLVAGHYNVTVTDANGCSATAAACVIQPASGIYASASATNIACYGGNDGAVSLSVSGGTAPYSFIWSNGATTQDISNLVDGHYNVTVADANGCSATAAACVVQPASGVWAYASATNIACYGGNDGAVNLTVTGGSAPYSFIWSNGATTQNLSNLSAGHYNVTVTDANGCSATAAVCVIQPASGIYASASATNIACYGGNDGAVNLTVIGGSAPYSFNWSNGATTQNISNLSAGHYNVTITDANGCSATAAVCVIQPASGIYASASATNIACYGGNDGAVNLTVIGGSAPYSFNWSNGATTQNISNLSAGHYNVTITDANGCSATAAACVIQPSTGVSASASATNIACYGGNDGAVSLSVSGGTSPYSFNWSTGATTQNISNLSAGHYNVTVTDANGCSATAAACVIQPASGMYASASATNIACYGGNDGAVNLTVNGGAAPYSFNWSNGATTQNISNLSAGHYNVTITDANGCSTTAAACVIQPASGIYASARATNIACYHGNDGMVSLTVYGGTAPYSFNWSNGATTQNISNLSAGHYNVTVTDANGCSATAAACVIQPDAIDISKTVTNITCFGAHDGSISLTVSGGTLSYSFSWSNGATTQNLNNLCTGIYSVTVTDAHGCTATASACISQPAAINICKSVSNISCNGAHDGSITLNVTGGTSPYSFIWSNGATTQNINNLCTGTYSVTVTDAHGCSATASVCISQPTALTICKSSTNVSCHGSHDGSVNINVNGGTSPYSFLWSNGATTQNISNLSAGTYSVTVTDAHGCFATASACIMQPSAINISACVSNISCHGEHDGSIHLTVTGGSSPYTYSWAGGSTSQNRSNLCAGTYTVTVTDAHGCTATASFGITQPSAINISACVSNISCHGEHDGSIHLTVTGGSSPYTYSWAGGSTSQNRSNLCAGTYTVTVTDAHGCTATASFCIAQPSAINLSFCATNVTCGGHNGAVHLTVCGGTGPYSFHWNNCATTQNISCLSVGNYCVTITDAHGCTATGCVCVQSSRMLSADTESQPETISSDELTVKMYPNPFVGAIHVNIESKNDEIITLSVYDVTGTLVNGKREAFHETDITFTEPLAKGIYFLRVSQGKETKTLRIIKAE